LDPVTMPVTRFYSSTAGKMVLQLGVSSVDTTLQVDTTVGLPGSTPFTLLVDAGNASEEIVTVIQVSGNSLVVTRGEDGTAAQPHANGAVIRHALTSRDLRESRQHEAATASVHGTTSAVVGVSDVQVLTNKNLSAASNTFPSTLATSAALTAEIASRTTGDTAASQALAAHSALTTVHGVVGDVVGTTSKQTLANKTLDGAVNTFTNLPLAAMPAEVQAVTANSTGGAWIAFTPSLQRENAGNPVGVAYTVNYARYKVIGKTVIAQASVVCTTGTGTDGAVIALPLAARERRFNIGTLSVYGTNFPADQSGIAEMYDTTRLVVTAYTAGFRSAAAGNRVDYSVVYEIP